MYMYSCPLNKQNKWRLEVIAATHYMYDISWLHDNNTNTIVLKGIVKLQCICVCVRACLCVRCACA